MKKISSVLAVGLMTLATSVGSAQIVINEFVYDDTSTDDREFVELYNAGNSAVDISGWSLGGRDFSGVNTFANIPASTMLAAGAYYVIGQTGVQNVNQVVGSIFENDAEQLELWNGASGTGTLIDGVVYEGNKGVSSHGALAVNMVTQVGGATYWGNHVGTDVAGTPLRTLTTVARYIDGRDNNINGRDFGMMGATPGLANSVGSVSSYAAPNVNAHADGQIVSEFAAGGFVGGRAITPGVVVAGLNPNAIPASPTATKATTVWDGSGGGNAAVSDRIFNGAVSFDILAYLDTRHMTVNSNSTNVKFRGGEQTMYGLGSTDAFANSADLSTGSLQGLGATVSGNGATGLAWYYEKIGESVLGLDDVSQKLYLVNANDGGNANNAAGPLAWNILATIDLGNVLSDWYRLSISMDGAGNGTAIFDNQTFNFTSLAGAVGEFYVSYRENTTLGTVGVPSFIRPATFTIVPEPTALVLVGLGGMAFLSFRRRGRN